MSAKRIREALEAFREKAQGDEPALWEAALSEVQAIEKAAREYFTWSVSPESRGVLTAIAKEST